jgi:sugar O-acyltransferase (sialic acid O-acetyltransferase NeuD family)
MENIYIIGAGDLGREIESWFDFYSKEKNKFRIVGYLDDNPNALDGFPSDYKIVGNINDFEFDKNDWVILAIANTSTKEKIYRELRNKVKFYTFIPENVILGKYVDIEDGSIILPNTIISTNVKIGKCVIVNIGTQIGHDVIIDDFCSLMANIDLGGSVHLGKKVYIGSNATIIPQIYIADDVKIGAGSIVIKKILKSQTVFGNPAKKI